MEKYWIPHKTIIFSDAYMWYVRKPTTQLLLQNRFFTQIFSLFKFDVISCVITSAASGQCYFVMGKSI